MDAFLVLIFIAILIGTTAGAWWGQKARRRRRERWPNG